MFHYCCKSSSTFLDILILPFFSLPIQTRFVSRACDHFCMLSCSIFTYFRIFTRHQFLSFLSKHLQLSRIPRIYVPITDLKCSSRGKFHFSERCFEKTFFQKQNTSSDKIISEMCTSKCQRRVARSALARTG